jgi:hypothetical protein
MYSKALIGYEKVVRPNHPSSRSLQDTIRAFKLDRATEKQASVDVEQPMNNGQGGPSHLGTKEALLD